jgi:RNA polymerase sigma factor (sigma-70 family)
MNYLSSAPDAELIKNIKINNDYASDSINAISERHGAIVTEVIKKFSSVLANTGIAPIDVYHEKDLLIYNSAMSYDDTKGAKFTSWLYNQTRYLCLNTINKESKKNKFTDDKKFDYLNNQTQKDFITEENQLQYIIKEINNISDCNERKIMELRYLDKDKNNNWKDIAKAVGLSVPTVLKIHKKHINSIKNKFNAEHEL